LGVEFGAGSPVAIIETPHSPKIAALAKAKILPFACFRFPRVRWQFGTTSSPIVSA
jgi:hypothetical protein